MLLQTLSLSVLLQSAVAAGPFERLDNAQVPETVTSGSPSELARIGDMLLFTASDLTTGRELWRTDGTLEGTRRVRDIRAGADGSFPSSLTVAGSQAFFIANDGEAGQQLWKTDGTEAGTTVVKRFSPSRAFWGTAALMPVGARVFFVADDGVHGPELWVTDGSEAGTGLVRDLVPGPDGIDVSGSFAALDGKLYFTVDDGAHGTELWSTDGTADGTQLVRDILPGAEGSFPSGLTVVGSVLYFAAEGGPEGRELWKSDGTEAGTVLHADVLAGPESASPEELQARDGVLYFRAEQSGASTLWRTDGGAPIQISPLALYASASRTSIATLPGAVFFIAGNGRELWTAGPTGESPSLLLTVGETETVSVPTSGERLLYFQRGDQLWRTDGTVAGTFQLAAPVSRYGSRALLGGDTLLFPGSDDRGVELWRTDGTPASTAMLKDVGPPRFDSRPYDVIRLGDDLYFQAMAPDRATKLWKVPAATGLPEVFRDHAVSNLTATEDALYFFKEGLWRTDGTPTGTRQLLATLGSLGQLTPAGRKLFFTYSLGTTGRELWVSDGTEPGTRMVSDLTEGADSSSFRSMAAVGDALVFVKTEPAQAGYTLWKSDGTSEGTQLLHTFPPTEKGHVASMPLFTLYSAEGTAYFAAPEGLRTVLWKTDLTPEGTQPMPALTSEGPSPEPLRLGVVGATLYVHTQSPTGDLELWRTDGSLAGTAQVHRLAGGSLCRAGTEMLASDGLLYFSAYDAAHGCELWEVSGEGTVRQVGDLWPGPIGSVPVLLSAAEGVVLFAASTPETGYELWATRPQQEAWQVQDLVTGVASSTPTLAVRAGPTLFLSATDRVGQRELYRASWEAVLASAPSAPQPSERVTPTPRAAPEPPAQPRPSTGCGCGAASGSSLLPLLAAAAAALTRLRRSRRSDA